MDLHQPRPRWGVGGGRPPHLDRGRWGSSIGYPIDPPSRGGSGGGRGGSWWGHGGSTPGDPPRTPSGRGSGGGPRGSVWGVLGGPPKVTPRDPPKSGGFGGSLQKTPKNLKKWGRRLSATFGSKKVAEGAFHLLKVAQKKPLIRRSDPQNPTFGGPRDPPKPTPGGGPGGVGFGVPPGPRFWTPGGGGPGGVGLGGPRGTPNRPPGRVPWGTPGEGVGEGSPWGSGSGCVPDGRSVRREEGMRRPTLQTHVCDRGRVHRSHRSMMVPGWTFSVLSFF